MTWIRTWSGGRFDFAAPSAADIRLEDIAHALGQLCRFTGHTSSFYSVAEHSVHVSHLVPPEHARWALLHDAAEAYIGDVARPLKLTAGMDGYRELEARVEAAVLEAFGVELTPEAVEAVKKADLQMLSLEARELLGVEDFESAGWTYWCPPPRGIELIGWYPAMARACFLDRCRQLGVHQVEVAAR